MNVTPYLNYVLIAVLSMIILFLVPFLGSVVGMALVLPTTTAGWIVFATTKTMTALMNIVIFHCFVSQGKVNSKKHPNFIKANELLNLTKNSKVKYLSPKQFLRHEYGFKATTIFVTTLFSAFALTQAVLTFDWVQFLTYLITLIFGLVTGVIEMMRVQDFWQEDYLGYAEQLVEQEKAEAEAQKLAEATAKED